MKVILLVYSAAILYFKGIVRRERRGVKSILNRQLLLWDRGAEHFFFSGFSPHLVVNKFPFPVIPAQSVGTLICERLARRSKLF